MNKYEKMCLKIHRDGAIENELIATEIINNLQSKYGNVSKLIDGWSDANMYNLFLLLVSPLRNLAINELNQVDKYGRKKYLYSLNAELQLIITNICHSHNNGFINDFIGLPSLERASVFQGGFTLETHVGSIDLYKVSYLFPMLTDYTEYGECHYQCRRLILSKSELSASTALIDRSLGGKHYHSFVNYHNWIIDLSHNAVMTREHYLKAFQPEILNTVYGYELESEEERINHKESLGKDKELLLRLALDKQVR